MVEEANPALRALLHSDEFVQVELSRFPVRAIVEDPKQPQDVLDVLMNKVLDGIIDQAFTYEQILEL